MRRGRPLLSATRPLIDMLIVVLPSISRSSATRGAGVGAGARVEGGGFWRGDDDVDYPTVMFHVLRVAIR